MAVVAAITPAELRRSLEAIPALQELEDVLDSDLIRIATRKTAIVLHYAGLTALPADGTITRHKIDDAVHRLSMIEMRRLLRPEDPEVLRELQNEDQGIIRSLEAVKEQNSARATGWGAGVTGC